MELAGPSVLFEAMEVDETPGKRVRKMLMIKPGRQKGSYQGGWKDQPKRKTENHERIARREESGWEECTTGPRAHCFRHQGSF